MSTKTTNATKRKLAAKKKTAKTMAPMSAAKLERINAQRVKQGLEPLTGAEVAATKPAKGKPAAAAKPQPLAIRQIIPSETPIQELLRDKVVWRDSGLIEVSKDVTGPEAVSLVSFFEDTRRSSGMHIGAVIVAAEKNKTATLDEIAKATGLERKTLHNMASAMRNTSLGTIEGALKKGVKSGHDVTFTHVAAVAGLEPEKKKLLLDKVADEGLTVAALNVEVRKLAPKSAKRAAAAKKKEAAKKAADDAKIAAATAATGETGADTGGEGTAGAGGVVIIESPLSEDDEKSTEAAETALDTFITFIRSKTFGLLPAKRKVQFLQPMRQVSEAFAVLMTELSHISGK